MVYLIQAMGCQKCSICYNGEIF